MVKDYYCEYCTSKSDASKKLIVDTLPNVSTSVSVHLFLLALIVQFSNQNLLQQVLCVVLKRFCWTSSVRAKIDTPVKFPLRGLDLSPFSRETENAIYDLNSVVIHHGTGYVLFYSAVMVLLNNNNNKLISFLSFFLL